MLIHSNAYKPRSRQRVVLDAWPTDVDPLFRSPSDYEAILKSHVDGLNARQQMHYAAARYSVLLILQGMDAAGKDGTIKHILSGVDPRGCDVTGFKSPSIDELAHDYLWRTTCRLPERGRIGIFNRSYYEEVLIARVHPAVLAAQNLPDECRNDKRIWEHRFRSINDMERHLHVNGTRIIKIFLHVSKQEQKKRFLARIADASKNWKFSRADLHERKYWNAYAAVYAQAISATNTRYAPWFIVPADEKFNSRLIVSQIVMDAFDDLTLAYPRPTPRERRELLAIGRRLR